MTDDLPTRTSPAWQRHRAARLLAQHARDAGELTDLLDMLGLTAEEGRVPPREQPAPEPVRRVTTLDEECAGRLGNLLRTALPSSERRLAG